jgi:hypothetical protein
MILVEFWLLVFMPPGAMPFDGGAYLTHEKCIASAQMQLPKWRADYGPRLTWRCRFMSMNQ